VERDEGASAAAVRAGVGFLTGVRKADEASASVAAAGAAVDGAVAADAVSWATTAAAAVEVRVLREGGSMMGGALGRWVRSPSLNGGGGASPPLPAAAAAAAVVVLAAVAVVKRGGEGGRRVWVSADACREDEEGREKGKEEVARGVVEGGTKTDVGRMRRLALMPFV